MTDKNCGRIDDHPAHDWKGYEEPDWLAAPKPRRRVTFHCKGAPITEGAQR